MPQPSRFHTLADDIRILAFEVRAPGEALPVLADQVRMVPFEPGQQDSQGAVLEEYDAATEERRAACCGRLGHPVDGSLAVVQLATGGA